MIKTLESMIESGKKNIHLISDQIKNCTDHQCNDGWITEKVKDTYNFDNRHSCQYLGNKLTSEYKHEILNARYALNYIEYLPPEYKKVFRDINKIKSMSGYHKFKDFFEKSDKKILWIYGPVGSGKTTILIYLKIKSMLVNQPECRLIFESSYKIEYGELKAPEIRHKNLIDDARNQSKHYSNFYYNLFDRIRSSRIKIAMTSNYSPKIWCARFENQDDAIRIFDRMKGILEVVEMNGRSKR
jgi:DNA replication protein DnaC